MRSYGTANRRCASITSRPLFTIVAELIVTNGPMSQLGCVRAWLTVTCASSSSVEVRKAPPDAVSTSRETSCSVPARRHCASAECSESTGTSWPGWASAVTKVPPITNDSLLANATVLPATSAAMVDGKPTAPASALSTTSTRSAQTLPNASVPTRNSGIAMPVGSPLRSSSTAVSSVTATTSGRNSMI